MIYPMIPPPTATFSPLEEKEARRLLLSGKPQDADTLTRWLADLPSTTASDLLAKIAGEAKRSPNRLPIHVIAFCALTVLWLVGRALKPSMPMSPFAVFAIFGAMGAHQVASARAARKAAFLLAHRDDYRAVAPLARLWNARPRGTTAASDNDAVERALTQLLTGLTAYKYENGADESVRDLLDRAFALPSRRPSPSALPDLSETRADLLLSALRYLAHATPGKESGITHELIARIASEPITETTPNRAAVHETAALCLDPAHNATPLALIARGVGTR